MDAPTATLAAAAIAGLVALVTTVVGYLNIRRQLLLSREEAERSRSHQIAMTAMARRDSAASELWVALYRLQSAGRLSPELETQIVAAMMWLPEEVRAKVADPLVHATEPTRGPNLRNDISELQRLLLNNKI